MRPSRHQRQTVVTFLVATLVAACASTAPVTRPIDRIEHVIVIYQENWSFDGLFGKFPGANGLDNAAATTPQVDKTGRPYRTLPPSLDNRNPRAVVVDRRIPADLPVAPFDLAQYVPPTETAGNPLHGSTSSSTRSTAARWTASSRGPMPAVWS